MFCTRCLRASVARRPILRQKPLLPTRLYSTEPPLSTPTSASSEPKPASDPRSRSICVEGTVLNGLNYSKGGQDPVAMKDDAYPEWLWSCLDVMKKSSDTADADLGDEFSKSKKQRKLATKRQRALEEKLLAEGNLEALAPKVPIQQQSINLPGDEGISSVEDNIAAASARDALRLAMRKERRAKIKETNYLKSM